MRLTDFWSRMREHFGAAYAESFARDMVLTDLGGRTALQALEAGVPTRDVWRAICRSQDVPARLR